MSQTLAAIRVIKEHSKDWRITYAGDWHPELDTLLDDYCFLYHACLELDANLEWLIQLEYGHVKI